MVTARHRVATHQVRVCRLKIPRRHRGGGHDQFGQPRRVVTQLVHDPVCKGVTRTRPGTARERPAVYNSRVVNDGAGNHASLHPHDVVIGVQDAARVDDAGLPYDEQGFVRKATAQGLLIGACHVIHVGAQMDIRRCRQPRVGPRDRAAEREMQHERARTEPVSLRTGS